MSVYAIYVVAYLYSGSYYPDEAKYMLAFSKSLTHFHVLNAFCIIVIRSFLYACSIVLPLAPF